jgi:subtilisin family serine protease
MRKLAPDFQWREDDGREQVSHVASTFDGCQPAYENALVMPVLPELPVWEPSKTSLGLDQIVRIDAVANDPAYSGGQLWGMYGDQTNPANRWGSQAGEAWGAGYIGSNKVVIGVIDTGIDYTHPDLYLNIWLNPREIPIAFRLSLVDVDTDGLITFLDLNASLNAPFVTDHNVNGRIDAGDLLNDSRWENGLDEDGNGYIDDLIGWDFINGDNDPQDDNRHGTHVAGTIAASGSNGIGVAGVSWSTQLVALKFLGADGSGSLFGAVRAIDYFTAAAVANPGQDFAATNNSWGGGDFSQPLLDAIVRGARQDILFVAAAGNGGGDRVGDNNDATGNFPSNYDTTAAVGFDAVVAVGVNDRLRRALGLLQLRAGDGGSRRARFLHLLHPSRRRLRRPQRHFHGDAACRRGHRALFGHHRSGDFGTRDQGEPAGIDDGNGFARRQDRDGRAAGRERPRLFGNHGR